MAAGFLWTIAVLGILFGVLSWSSPQSYAQNEQAQNAPTNENANAEHNVTKKHNGGSTGWRKYKEEIEHNEKLITAVSTIFIAAFTVLLAFATFFLWSATRDLVEDAKHSGEENSRNMQAAIAESRRSADAAQASAEAAKTTMFYSQRAWVFLNRLQAEVNIRSDGRVGSIRIGAVWDNRGVTPALNCENEIGTLLVEGPVDANINIPPGPGGDLQRFNIGPNTFQHYGGDIIILRQDLEKLWKKQARLFVSTKIEYSDVFAGTKRHKTIGVTEFEIRTDFSDRVFKAGDTDFTGLIQLPAFGNRNYSD